MVLFPSSSYFKKKVHKNYTVFIYLSRPGPVLPASKGEVLTRPLDDKSTPLNGVDDDEATLEEGVVAPCTDKLQTAAVGLVVVLRVDVEVSDLLNEAARGVLRERGDVQGAVAGAVVALVSDAVDDEPAGARVVVSKPRAKPSFEASISSETYWLWSGP